MHSRSEITQSEERLKFFGQFIQLTHTPSIYSGRVIIPPDFKWWLGTYDELEIDNACNSLGLHNGHMRLNKFGRSTLDRSFKGWDEALHWCLDNPRSIRLLFQLQAQLSTYGHQWDIARHVLLGLYVPKLDCIPPFPPLPKHSALISALSEEPISLNQFKAIAGDDFKKHFTELRYTGYTLHLTPLMNKEVQINMYEPTDIN